MKKREKSAARIADELDCSANAIARLPEINIIGRSRIEVDGCTGIASYTDDTLELHMDGYTVSIIGKSIVLRGLSRGLIKAEGDFSEIALKSEKVEE